MSNNSHLATHNSQLNTCCEAEVVSLVEHLVHELNITATQAEGGAGLLLCLAQHKLDSADFLLVADAIPAISDIMAKAPRYEAKMTGPARATVSRWFGGLGGLSFLSSAFALIDLDKTMIPPFVDAIVSYFNQRGGSRLESLLQTVLC